MTPQQKYQEKKRAKLLDWIGGDCWECGNRDRAVLQIDYKGVDGNRKRPPMTQREIAEDVDMHPGRYRLLCLNCKTKQRGYNRQTSWAVDNVERARRIGFITRALHTGPRALSELTANIAEVNSCSMQAAYAFLARLEKKGIITKTAGGPHNHKWVALVPVEV